LNIYETDKLLAEYLLFHYGTPEEVLPEGVGPTDALGYPARCVSECLNVASLPAEARALDLGCAVGRASFELARSCRSVLGIDFSERFIAAAIVLQARGELGYRRAEEGDLITPLVARVPEGIDRRGVRFEVGDAMHLRGALGSFDVVLMANLIDRLIEPRRCLAHLAKLVNPGGRLIITSPYTWLEEFTPREHWLGGFERDGRAVNTLEGLKGALERDFDLIEVKDLPFLLREHARKFQWSVAQASIWRRRGVQR
jgi:putative 4-mercaptohistidine N1-methyltranferase